MKEKKHRPTDPNSTLITLDQLSQTIEVMTNVVNRLREHLSEQVIQKSGRNTKRNEDKIEGEDPSAFKDTTKNIDPADQKLSEKTQKINEKSVVIEIRHGTYTNKNDDPTTLH